MRKRLKSHSIYSFAKNDLWVMINIYADGD